MCFDSLLAASRSCGNITVDEGWGWCGRRGTVEVGKCSLLWCLICMEWRIRRMNQECSTFNLCAFSACFFQGCVAGCSGSFLEACALRMRRVAVAGSFRKVFSGLSNFVIVMTCKPFPIFILCTCTKHTNLLDPQALSLVKCRRHEPCFAHS